MSCESFEIDASALADGELEPERLLTLVDHLTGCPSCRRLYRDIRALDTLAASLRERAVAPAAIWDRIAGESGAAAPRRVPRWALAAAAAIAGAIALWSGLRVAESFRAPDRRDVALSARAGAMTERRFVELTVELLESAPRYRRAMRAVLEEVASDDGAEDGSSDVRVPRSEQAPEAAVHDDAHVTSAPWRSGPRADRL